MIDSIASLHEFNTVISTTSISTKLPNTLFALTLANTSNFNRCVSSLSVLIVKTS